MRRLFLLVAAMLLTACGFQLRGAYALPFETLHIALAENTELHALIKRSVEASSQTRIVADAKSAQAILTITDDVAGKNVLTLSSTGRVTEYQLSRSVAFRVHDAANRDLIPPGRIVIRRDVGFSDVQVLAKEAEETQLRRDMQNDLVQQLLRRLATAKPQLVQEPPPKTSLRSVLPPGGQETLGAALRVSRAG